MERFMQDEDPYKDVKLSEAQSDDLDERKYRDIVQAQLSPELENERKTMESEGKILYNGVWKSRSEVLSMIQQRRRKRIRNFIGLIAMYVIAVFLLFALSRFMLIALR